MRYMLKMWCVVAALSVAAFGGIQLDQGSNYARLTSPDTGTPAFSANWTYCTWLKTTIINPGATYIVMYHGSNIFTNIQFLMVIRTDNKFHVELAAGIVTSTNTVTDGNWHAMCVTRDGSNNWTIYLDGVQNGTAVDATAQAPSGANHTSEGADEAGGFTCECSFAESVWYQTALTLNQIKAYAKGIPPSQIDALHYVGTSNGLYWPLYFALPALGALDPDVSGGKWNPQQQSTTGTYTTVNHCPCSPPAGAEGH